MAAQKGRDILVKIHNGTEFITVAGLRATTLELNARPIDATTIDSPGWRELLPCASLRQAKIIGRGLFKDAASDAKFREAWFEGQAITAQLCLPDFGTIEGEFQISTLSWTGEVDDLASFAVTLESAGGLSFTVST